MRSQSPKFPYKLNFVFVAVLLVATLSGCAQFSSPKLSASLGVEDKACLVEFVEHDKLIRVLDKTDAQYAPISGFPFLRANRLLDALNLTIISHKQRLSWLNRLADLDRRARHLENNNLPKDQQVDLQALNNCRISMVAHLAKNTVSLSKLSEAVNVPDSYQIEKRFLGLYPLLRWPVFRGVLKLHADESPNSELKPSKTTRFYTTPAAETKTAFHETPIPPTDILGFPALEVSELKDLFEAHAPIWAVETVTDSDLPGALKWTDEGVAADTSSPTVYEHTSYGLFEGKPVLQLMYTVWFSSVPRTGTMDIYAGKIDGLTFRVTLDHDLQALIVDVMHNCGCYYMAFPSPKLAPKLASSSKQKSFDEPFWVPYELTPPSPNERYLIQLNAGNHFVASLSTALTRDVMHNPNKEVQEILALPYDSLRSLPSVESDNRSAFSPRGLIENSHRLERFILWPMGILSAGAMRQSGHHAIAFIGRRHFDDPDLISRYFYRR